MKLHRVLWSPRSVLLRAVCSLRRAFRAEATPENSKSVRSRSISSGRVLVQVENNYVDPARARQAHRGCDQRDGREHSTRTRRTYRPRSGGSSRATPRANSAASVSRSTVAARSSIVIAPIEGSPAQRAGIKSGDQIVGVDGEDVDRAAARQGRQTHAWRCRFEDQDHDVLRETQEQAEMAAKEAGAEGGRRRVRRRRRRPAGAGGSTLTFELTREVIHVSAVTSTSSSTATSGTSGSSSSRSAPTAELMAGDREDALRGKGEGSPESSSTCARTRAASSTRRRRSPTSSSPPAASTRCAIAVR